MTLATHIAIAGAISKPLLAGGMGPLGLFIVSVSSHYLADTIPHYDYKLRYFVDEGEVAPPFKLGDFLIRDVGKVAGDALLGIILIFLVTGIPFTFLSILHWSPVIIGATLPDLLQAVRWVVPGALIDKIQKVQEFVHARKLSWGTGSVLSQTIILLLALGATRLF